MFNTGLTIRPDGALRARLRMLAANESGVSAVEFALILPILITLYMGAVEMSQAVAVDRRVTAVSSATADLVAQTEKTFDSWANVPPNEDPTKISVLEDVFEAARTYLRPYGTTPLTITVSSVCADGNGDTKVDWSVGYNGGAALTEGADHTLPDGLTAPFSSVIMATVSYSYSSPVSFFIPGGVVMTETFYLRPRRSLNVEKPDKTLPYQCSS